MIIYGLMKFIEQIPERYDKMIGFLTLGGHKPARKEMLKRIHPGTKVLDIGCGTGSFLLRAAKKGGLCKGIDAALPMLTVFRRKLEGVSEAENIAIHHGSAALLSKTFANEKFDLITASLILGELPPIVLQTVLEQIPGLLSPGGRFLICDEFWPTSPIRSFLYSFVLSITFVPNFILTRTMIKPVADIETKLEKAGLTLEHRIDYALGVVSLLTVKASSK